VVFETAHESLEAGGQILQAGERAAQKLPRASGERPRSVTFLEELTENGGGVFAQVEFGVEGAADFLDGEHGLGHERVVTGQRDAVVAEDEQQLEHGTADLLASD